MATEIISSIRATGGDYTSLTAWEAAIPTDLITLDEQHIAECYDDWPTGLEDSLLISARTTDTTRNIVIRAAEDHEFDFVTKTGFYIESTVWNKRGIELTGSVHVTVKNIGIYINSSSGDGIKFKDEVPGLVENVSVWERSAGGLNYGFIGGGHGTRCINCIVEGAGIRGYYTGWIKSAEFLNCIAVDCATGFQSNGTLGVAKNCVAYNCTISYANISATDTANNAATDGATNTPPGASPYTSDVLSADFIDVANDDFHLSATSGLIGQGANLSADFTTDIDGDTRLASGAWDIGIDHYVAAGGGQGDLSATASAAAQAIGDVIVHAPVSAAAMTLVNADGALSTAINLTGMASTISFSAGVADTSISLSASALSQSLSSAGLDISALMLAQASALAEASATLEATGAAVELSGSGAAFADTDTEITLQIELAGQALSDTLAQSDLSTGQALLATAAADVAATGALTADVPVVAPAHSQVSAQGGLNASLPITTLSAAASHAFGGLNVRASMSALALANALLQAGLSADSIGSLATAASSQAEAEAVIQLHIPLSATAITDAYGQGLLLQGGMIAAPGRYTAIAAPRRYTATAIKRNYSVCA